MRKKKKKKETFGHQEWSSGIIGKFNQFNIQTQIYYSTKLNQSCR